jgi:hypothetical protein
MRWIWMSGLTTGETYTAVRPIAGDIIVFVDGRKWKVDRVELRAMPMEITDRLPIGTLRLTPIFCTELSKQNQV